MLRSADQSDRQRARRRFEGTGLGLAVVKTLAELLGGTVAAIEGDPRTRRIPVTLVTALDDLGAKMLGLTAGAEDFVTKPVHRDELHVRIRNHPRLRA